MTDSNKEQAIIALRLLAETCQSALLSLANLSNSTLNNAPVSVDILRKDALSIHRLIHTSTTRLSVALGKPPPSYPIALVQLKELTAQVGQLTSCVSSFSPGILRKEAVWSAEETIQALEALVKNFESKCQLNESQPRNEEYLAKMGTVHDAVKKAQNLSLDEKEAIAKAWQVNKDGLNDSFAEVKEMMKDTRVEDEEDAFDDGWDELGGNFQKKLSMEERERVKKIYPLLRFTILLHDRLLSQYLLKAPSGGRDTIPHLNALLTFSNSLLVAMDDLAITLYSPQDVESIQEAAALIYNLLQDLEKELGFTKGDLSEDLHKLHIQQDSSQNLAWFKQCFTQIYTIYNNLSLA